MSAQQTQSGRDKRGRFVTGSKIAVEAGRKGGKKAQQKRTAHKLSKEERKRGGARSHLPLHDL